MGFFDDFGNAVEKKALESYKKIFSQATDSGLQDWWNKNQFNDEIDDRIKELAKDEMRRRGLYY